MAKDFISMPDGCVIDFWRKEGPFMEDPPDCISADQGGVTWGSEMSLAADALDNFQSRNWTPSSDTQLTTTHHLRMGTARQEALNYERLAVEEGRHFRIFANSMAEFWENDWALNWARQIALETIRETPHLAWVVFTRKPEAIMDLVRVAFESARQQHNDTPTEKGLRSMLWLRDWLDGTPPRNLWLGTILDDMDALGHRVQALLRVPAVLRLLTQYNCNPRMLSEGSFHMYRSMEKDTMDHWLVFGPVAEAFLVNILEQIYTTQSLRSAKPPLAWPSGSQVDWVMDDIDAPRLVTCQKLSEPPEHDRTAPSLTFQNLEATHYPAS